MKRASVITPEYCRKRRCSTGIEIKDLAGMEAAARKLVELGARAVVVKGGHMDKAVDRAVRRHRSARCLGGDHVKNGTHPRLRLHVCFGDCRATGLGRHCAKP